MLRMEPPATNDAERGMPDRRARSACVCLLLTSALSAADVRPAWSATDPIMGPANGDETSLKNPSIVYADGAYHVFFDVFIKGSREEVQYASAPSLAAIGSAPRSVIVETGGAPTVFRHGGKWYMIINHNRILVNESGNLGQKQDWHGIGKIFTNQPVRTNPVSGAKAPAWAPLDFWMIADARDVYLFYAMNNGTVGMTHQPLAVFPDPEAWSDHVSAIAERGNGLVFEAIHAYHSLADGRFYMAVEGIDGLNRKLALYQADSLGGSWKDGAWKLVDGNWACGKNLAFDGQPWSTMVSHPEALRAGDSLRMDIHDIHDSYWLFMGMRDTDGEGKGYGQWPWRLGLMRNGGKDKPAFPVPSP